MAKKKARRYTAEFKANAIELASQSDKPIAQVALDLDVPYQTLYQWLQVAGKVGPVVEPRAAGESAEDENRRLRRELDEVKRERDFLKKAAAFFARVNK